MRRPLEDNAAHCADVWNRPAPTVEVIDDMNKLRSRYTRSRSWVPVVFVDATTSTDPSLLAYHYYDSFTTLPAARVLAESTSELYTGPNSLFESAAHEILEALLNPDLNWWAPHPDASRNDDVAGEGCDPVQNTYPIAHAGTAWPGANFITREWFSAELFADNDLRKRFLASGRGFDHNRGLTQPGEVGPEGYVILRDRATGTVRSAARTATPWGARSLHELAAKRHPWSRSHRLGLRL